MTDIQSTEHEQSTAAPAAPPPRSMIQYGIAAYLLSVLLTAVGTFTDVVANDSPEDGSEEFWGWLGMMGVLLIVAVVVYRFWYARAAQFPAAPNTALIGGVLSFLAFPAFWSGLPAVLGIGAIVLGLRARGAKGYAGVALAVVSIGLAVFAAVFG